MTAHYINQYLAHSNVVILFSESVINEDLPAYNRGQLTEIFAAIITRFENNGNPHTLTKQWVLKGGLRGYYKIRMLPQMIRIVYKVEERLDKSIVTIVVIGPKKNEEAYTRAKKRLQR